METLIGFISSQQGCECPQQHISDPPLARELSLSAQACCFPLSLQKWGVHNAPLLPSSQQLLGRRTPGPQARVPPLLRVIWDSAPAMAPLCTTVGWGAMAAMGGLLFICRGWKLSDRLSRDSLGSHVGKGPGQSRKAGPPMWTQEGAETVLTDGKDVSGQVGLSTDGRMEVFQVEVGGQGTQVWWEPCRPGREGSRLHPSTLGLGTGSVEVCSTMTLVCIVTHTAGACCPAGTSVSRELNGLHALPPVEPPGGLRVCACPQAAWPCQEVPSCSACARLRPGAGLCPVVTVGFAWLVPGLPVQERMEHSSLAVGQR